MDHRKKRRQCSNHLMEEMKIRFEWKSGQPDKNTGGIQMTRSVQLRVGVVRNGASNGVYEDDDRL